MTFAEFKEFYEANKAKDEVQALFPKVEMTDETVTAYLESDKGRPIVDRYVNRAVKSHDEKRQPEIERMVREATEKAKKESAMSAEDQLKTQMEELRAQITQRDTDLARRDLIAKLHAKASEMGVPLDIAVDLDNPNLTEERAMSRMEAYAKQHAEKVAEVVNARLAGGHKPGSGNEPSGKTDVSKLSLEEAIRLEEKGELNQVLTR